MKLLIRKTAEVVLRINASKTNSPLWDTNQPSDTRGEQLEDWVIAHSASVLNAAGGLSSPGVSLAHPYLADEAELTVGEDLGSDHLPITIELRYQTPVATDPVEHQGF